MDIRHLYPDTVLYLVIHGYNKRAARRHHFRHICVQEEDYTAAIEATRLQEGEYSVLREFSERQLCCHRLNAIGRRIDAANRFQYAAKCSREQFGAE